jgi:hypothetical protein
MDEDKIRKMKVVELKEELKRIKKPIYGVKAVLVERLIDYYTKESVNNSEAIGKVILDQNFINLKGYLYNS